MSALVSQVSNPECRQLGVPLEGLIHQFRATAPPDCGLDHRQWQRRDAETVSFDDVGGGQIPASQLNAGTADVVAYAWHGDLDQLWCESGQVMPPSCGKPGGRSSAPIAPDGCSNPRGIGERSIVYEEDTSRAPPPMSGPDQPIDRVPSQAASFGLGERDDAIVATQEVIEHV